ncbi:MAG: KH domain-containing protein [Desulfobulbaceae bacterium]|nr:KH domain-containing protein [Desulfobulbaceae bacterium]HIJ78240.1 KH domain-containing protein [Deltaproteobacteria bacterium]
MKELVSFMASQLVDDPGSVQVTETESEDTRVFELRVAKDELGKVIGKQGRTARAMRSVLSAAAGIDKMKARLEIVE